MVSTSVYLYPNDPPTVATTPSDVVLRASVATASGTGTVYTVNTGDTLTLTDSVARTASYLRNVTDAITLSDKTTRQVAHVRGVADSIPLSDTSTRSMAYQRNGQDALVLIDALTRSLATSRSSNDTLTLTEALSFILTVPSTAPLYYAPISLALTPSTTNANPGTDLTTSHLTPTSNLTAFAATLTTALLSNTTPTGSGSNAIDGVTLTPTTTTVVIT